ncbi:histone deacetylase [Coemansia aciculifera]|uniref:histone deacetylase n=1 Tax=Coemansia aciculifera TaxID=417176 RepID=A0A9W8IL76_9FUNG|nr:histone deacetylase [Coemansia aciculifera]
MKPHRIRMTHNLVMSYELYKKMSIYRAAPATCQEMTQFHSDDYVEFLHRVTPENAAQFPRELSKYNFEDDCPVFDGMFDLFSLSAGSSMEGAARLNRGLSDICINWSGGLHHAKKCEASGFCYINDIVLAILELLRHHQRVLYIDIDVHHGDGVEEAFYTTDRVMTCSFHKYGEFFPGTGDLRDIGEAKGKYYAVNFPLRDGIDDASYQSVFKPVVQGIMEWYQPDAVVLQCGTDSLAGDKLGTFNLSMEGHAECVRFVKDFNLPTLVLGGGGYTIRNVSRVWAYETGILVGTEMDRKLPMNDYMDYYAPEYTLNVPAYNVENSNSPEYLERIKNQVLMNLERTHFAPSVQMQDTPRDVDRDTVDEDALDPDERMPETIRDQHVVPDTEMYEADSMGMPDFSRDNTKVVNEERNDLPLVTADEVKTTTSDDVEMVDADALQGDAVLTETSQLASSMEVDGAEPKLTADASPTTLTQELVSVAVADNLLANDSSSDKQASAESVSVTDGSATTNPVTTSLEVNDDGPGTVAEADMAKEKSLDPTAELEASLEPKPELEPKPVASLLAVPNSLIDDKQAESTDTTDAVNDAEAVQSTEADAKADTESVTDSGTGAHASDQISTSTSTSTNPVTDSIADGIASLAVDVTAAGKSVLATPTHLAAEPSSETTKDNAGSESKPSTEGPVAQVSQISKPPARANAPVHKSVLTIKSGDREDGEATEDDYDDEDGEIRDS